MPRDILTLKCNQYHLVASASTTALAANLFDYFASHRSCSARSGPAPDDKQKKSSAVLVPATPDISQASKDIQNSIAPEIERLATEKLAGTSSLQKHTKSKNIDATCGSSWCSHHRSSSLTSSSDDNSGKQEARHTSKKSQLSHSLLLNCFSLKPSAEKIQKKT